MEATTFNKKDLLHRLARDYVVKGLGAKNFDAIPYHDQVSLRAPLCPGGSNIPLKGRENLRTVWWAPLPSLLGTVTFLDSYVNQNNTAVTVEFQCQILNPACILRVMDRFFVDKDGKIIEQENFFDPTAITHPA